MHFAGASMRRAEPSTHELTDLLPGLASLWSESMGSAGICIAVLDGPVDLCHPCFSGAQIDTRELLLPSVADEGPASAHGTHVASIIFGQHSGPIRGIAPGCRGLIIPVFSTGTNGTMQACSQLDLARAISQAVGEGAHIINISAGQLAPGGDPEDHLARAVRLCAENRILIVAAAGNEGCECLHVPAALPSVLAVAPRIRKDNPWNPATGEVLTNFKASLPQARTSLGACLEAASVIRPAQAWRPQSYRESPPCC